MLELSKYIGGTAIIGSAILFWDKIKFIFSRVSSIFIVTSKIDSVLHDAINIYASENFKKYKFQPLNHMTFKAFVRPLKNYMNVACENLTGTEKKIYWNKIFPLIIGASNGNRDKSDYSSDSSISFIRGTFNLTSIIEKSLELYNNRSQFSARSSRFYVKYHFGLSRKSKMSGGAEVAQNAPIAEKETGLFAGVMGNTKIIKWKVEDLGEELEGKNKIQTLAFPEEIDGFLQEIERWKNSKEWYYKKSIPWKRGWLLYGSPGTGKSAFVNAVAQYVDMPIHIFDLSTLSNMEFHNEWTAMQCSTPCIALVEDIDATFCGRDNITKCEMGDSLTFDCFLNCISGIQNSNGVFLIITTNNIKDLDEALGKPRSDRAMNGTHISTRPGRLDRVLEFKILDEMCRRKIADRILEDCKELIETTIKEGEGDTGAQFQERCSQIALKNYWEKT